MNESTEQEEHDYHTHGKGADFFGHAHTRATIGHIHKNEKTGTESAPGNPPAPKQ